jgi:hypothetical protein
MVIFWNFSKPDFSKQIWKKKDFEIFLNFFEKDNVYVQLKINYVPDFDGLAENKSEFKVPANHAGNRIVLKKWKKS